MRATRPMRQTLGNAVRAVVVDQVARCRQGETDVPATRAAIAAFVHSAWGTVPTQVTLAVDEMILLELERARLATEGDAQVRDRLVRDNVEAVLELEVPTRLERIRREWEDIGERVAPAAVRRAQRAVRRPEPLSALVPPAIWAEIRQAVERGDTDALGQALADVQDELEMNLRLRLDAKPEPREPVSELRLVGAPDPAFLQARELLLRQDPRALDEFSNLHYRRSANTIAKEWYAYALALFGQSTDIHDIIELLEAAIASDRFHEHRGWTARWNLACALRRLPSRADEALDVLLPVLSLDAHPAEAFELCLLWAHRAGPPGGPGHALPPVAPLRGPPPGGAPGRGADPGRGRSGRVPRPLPPDQPDPPRPGSRLPRSARAFALRGPRPSHARVRRDVADRGRGRMVPPAGRGGARGGSLQELGMRGRAQRGGRRPGGQLALPAPQLARHAASPQPGPAKEGAAAARAPRLGPASRLPRGRASACSARAGARRASRRPTRSSGRSGSALRSLSRWSPERAGRPCARR